MTDTLVTFHRARAMRKAPTDAERAMWRILRRDQLGVRFRRQHPIGPYIVDFLCPAHRLVIEVDGGQHNDSPTDEGRDAWLREKGYRVLRFWNFDVLTNADGVGRRICVALGREWRLGGNRGARGKREGVAPRRTRSTSRYTCAACAAPVRVPAFSLARRG